VKIGVLQGLAGEVALWAQSEGLSDERYVSAMCPPDDWRIRQVDPAARRALDLALDLKAMWPDAEVTQVHLGPERAIGWMRDEAARGCDDSLRVWADELLGAGTQVKALVLAAVASSRCFDLVLAGAASPSSAGGQLGVLVAGRLGVPCVTQVCAIERPDDSASSLVVTRALAGGYRERVLLRLPAVMTVVPTDGPPTHVASVPSLLSAQAASVPTWDLAMLGVSHEELAAVARPLRSGRVRPPRPRSRPLAVPDQSASAFERILAIVAGTVKQRRAQVVRGTADELAAQIVEAMDRRGWLDHLQGDGAVLPQRGAHTDEEPSQAG